MRLTEAITAADILTALIAVSDAKIWATELALLSGSRRVDFWTLEPVLSKGFRASAFEIKVSRNDFLRDRDGKQDGALKWSDRFWYVTPPGLLTKVDLPEWSGLQEWDGKAFRVVRKAPARLKAEPSWEFVASLIRNSGDCRRDTELLKSQVAFYEAAAERRRHLDKTRNQFQMNKWIRASSARAAQSVEKK
jgi:hypothetical protein